MISSRWLSLVGFSVALALAAGTLQAQEEKKEGGRTGRGFGMMGGGMMGGMSKGSLLAREQVQTELKLTQEQKDKLTEVRRSSAPARGDFKNYKNLSEDEKKTRQEEAKKAAAESWKKMEAVLKPEQLTRLNGIFLQTALPQALKDEAIAKELKLSADQTKKIDEALQWGQDEQRKLFQGGAGGRDADARKKMQEDRQKIQKETDAKVLAVLTADQKAQCEKMKGAEFKLEEPARGPGGARGERGGRSKEKA